MNIIGHRGAAGLALENTEAAFRQAQELNLSSIELDVRLTYDKKLVVCHDDDLKDMANDSRKISHHNWAELKDLELKDGSRLLLLEDVLKKIPNQTTVLVELKNKESEYALLSVLDKFPKQKVVVISFIWSQLVVLHELRPKLPIYLSEQTKALEALQFARRLKLNGLMLNFWIVNPVIYWLARRANLTICVYTVNNRFFAWFLNLLYPQIHICTDYPNKFIHQKKG